MISVAAWLIIDAVLDNAIAVMTQSGLDDDEAVARASGLRQRGWETSEAHPRRGEGPAGWPPTDAPFEVELSETDRTFLLSQLDQAVATSRSILASPELPQQVQDEQENSVAGALRARSELQSMPA